MPLSSKLTRRNENPGSLQICMTIERAVNMCVCMCNGGSVLTRTQPLVNMHESGT